MRPTLRLALLWALVTTASVGRADAGVWDWIERLSGPGPFIGYGLSVDLACLSKETQPGAEPRRRLRVASPNPDPDSCPKRDTNVYVQLLIGVAHAKAGNGFPQVNLVSLEPSVMFPLARLTRHPENWERVRTDRKQWDRLAQTLDVGGGVGLYGFYGDGFDTHFSPSAHLTAHWYFLRLFSPSAKGRKARLVRFEYTPRLIFVNWDDAGVGVPDRGLTREPFDETFEFRGLSDVRIVINLSAFLR